MKALLISATPFLALFLLILKNRRNQSHPKTSVDLAAPDSSEASKIFQEVEKRKQRARDLGVPVLFDRLYQSHIRNYPTWIQYAKDRALVCSLVTEAKTLDRENVELVLIGRKYRFHLREKNYYTPNGEYHTEGDLEVFLEEGKILGLKMALEHNDFFTEWKSRDVEAFVEGNWIQDFQDLADQIEEEKKELERQEKESPEKLDQLKKDFGIQ